MRSTNSSVLSGGKEAEAAVCLILSIKPPASLSFLFTLSTKKRKLMLLPLNLGPFTFACLIKYSMNDTLGCWISVLRGLTEFPVRLGYHVVIT